MTTSTVPAAGVSAAHTPEVTDGVMRVTPDDPAAAPLREGQWQIEDLVFGKHTRYPIEVAPEISFGEPATQDAAIPYGDGLNFGVDSAGANTITFTGAVFSDDLARDMGWLSKWWRGHPVRKTPGAVVALRYCYNGQHRQVFGRPRNFAPIPGPTGKAWEHFVADFQCVDDKFYSQDVLTHRISLAPPALGGFVTPLVAPLVMTGSALSTLTEFDVGGMAPAWVAIDIHGPISGPELELYGQWTQRMPSVGLNYDQWLTLSSFPWARYIRQNNTVSRGGVLDQGSRKLSAMTLPPGHHEVVLSGIDPTGSAYADIRWREAFLTL